MSRIITTTTLYEDGAGGRRGDPKPPTGSSMRTTNKNSGNNGIEQSASTIHTTREAVEDAPPDEDVVHDSSNNKNNNDDDKEDDENSLAIEIKLDLKRLFFLFIFLFCIFPLLPIGLSLVYGGLFMAVDGCSFKEAFLYVVSNILAMANPLTPYTPKETATIVIDVYVAVTALITFGIMLNFVNLFEIPKALNTLMYRLIPNTTIVTVIALGLVLPASIGVMACVFGLPLAWLEHWAWNDGILYVLSNLLGLGNPLTDVIPTTFSGALFDVVISSAAFGTLAIFTDYVTILNPSKALRQQFRRLLGKIGIIKLNPQNADGLSESNKLHPLDYDRPSRYDAVDVNTTTPTTRTTHTYPQQQYPQQYSAHYDTILLPRPPSMEKFNTTDTVHCDEHDTDTTNDTI